MINDIIKWVLEKGFEPGSLFSLVYGRMGKVISFEWNGKTGGSCMLCVYGFILNGKDTPLGCKIWECIRKRNGDLLQRFQRYSLMSVLTTH